MKLFFTLFLSIMILSTYAISGQSMETKPLTKDTTKSDQQWKAELSDQEYHVLREKGTERAFSGEYWNHHQDGTYTCAGCGQPLFDSSTKFESGTGWPSYYTPASKQSVIEKDDSSIFLGKRTEILCSSCNGHLGHVFNDGPQPTGLRYCINSAALDFVQNSK